MTFSRKRKKEREREREAVINANQHWRLKSCVILKRGICFQSFPPSSIIETEI